MTTKVRFFLSHAALLHMTSSYNLLDVYYIKNLIITILHGNKATSCDKLLSSKILTELQLRLLFFKFQ